MTFHNNWQKFLQEDNIDEATAAKKRGIELPSMLAQLKKYSVPSGQKPTHYMHFSDLNKIGIKPQSGYETPLGIYFYPVNEEILGQLEKGKIPFASERKFLHVVKPRKNTEILYVDESFTEQDFNEKLVKLFSEPVGKKLTKRMARRTPDGEIDSYLEQVPYMYQEFEKFKKQVQKGHVEQELDAIDDLRRLLSKKDDEYFLESQTSDPYLKDAFEEIKKYFKYPGPYSRLDYFSNVIRQVATYTVKGQFDATQQHVDAVHKKLGYDPEVDSVRTLQRPSEKYPEGIFKEPGFNLNHAKAIMYAWDFLKQKSQEALKNSPDYPSLGINDVIGTGNKWGYFTAEQWRKHLGIKDNKSGTIQAIKMSPAVQLATNDAHHKFPLGILWNITRSYTKQKTNDMQGWSKIWRALGVGGVSDYTGKGMIHHAEPMQAVFFSRGMIDQVESFDNKMSFVHVKRREIHKYTREAVPYVRKAFNELIGRSPNKKELEYIADAISIHMRGQDFVNVDQYLQSQYESGTLGGYSTKRMFAMAIFEDKSEKIIRFARNLDQELSRSHAIQDLEDIFDLPKSGNPIDSPVGQSWDHIQGKLNFELRNDGLRTGQEAAARSLDALKQWFIKSKENFDKTLGKEYRIEFPFKSL
tara:strand:+ start:6472 stop:8388 length:1917 start_codon:yes stop_codon:yes gene_type:complete